MNPRHSVSPLLLLLLLATACLPVTTRTSNTTSGSLSNTELLLSQAETNYEQGYYQAATDLYKKYLIAEVSPPHIERILAAYGLAAEKSANFTDAVGAYERLITQFPASPFAAEAKPHLAAVYLTQGEAARAEVLILANINATAPDSKHQANLRLTLAQSQWLLGRYPEATENFLKAFQQGNNPTRAAAKEGILGSLIHLDSTSLTSIQQQYGQNFPGPETTYLLVYQAAAAPNLNYARTLAEYFNRYFSSNPLQSKIKELLQVLATPGAPLPAPAFGTNYDPKQMVVTLLTGEEAQALPSNLNAPPFLTNQIPIGQHFTIAALLPMTGPGAPLAEEAVAGLKLALSTLAPGALNLSIMDTASNPDKAAELIKTIAADTQVLVVVGPLLSPESNAAAKVADKASLPLIALSQRPALPTLGPNIFRIFLTPRLQTEAVARYATLIQGHKALGMIYPDDNYGRSLPAYFKDEAARQGAQVTVTESYQPKSTDWSALVVRLTGGEAAARHVSTNYQAQVNFTALYLPDSAGPVAQILPQLAYHDVTRMQYLGSSLWLNQKLLASSARYLQGAIIPTAISNLATRPETKTFITSFQKTYGHQPDQFAAYGYDAGLAIIQALTQGATTRETLRQTLSQGLTVAGATGPFSFDQSGDYLVEPTLLTIQDKEFILLRDPGPAARRP
ncbi:MAG: penicillin-binding protein activator [Candidatus Adiutrix intracellularis]|nr:penicillin-binding protein activator [Candidatus Adiutrix intracellularis]